MKALAVVAGGMGNIIQMTAAIRTIRERLGWQLDILSASLSGPRGAHADLDPVLPGAVYTRATVHYADYEGVVLLGYGSTGRVANWEARGLKLLNDPARQAITCDRSEVDVSMNACRELGVAENDLNWHGDVNWNRDCPERFDVVFANGYYRDKAGGHWDVKGFPGFGSLAAAIKQKWPRLSICSIGRDGREAIHGTVDRTGLPLLDSLALVARARFTVCTDSMALHAAAAIGARTYALFTATSVRKNFEPRFHWNARLVGRDDLICRADCQRRGHAWRQCPRRECQEIGIGHILQCIAEDYAGTPQPMISDSGVEAIV